MSNGLEIRHGNVYIHNKTARRGLRKLLARRAGHKPDGVVINEGGRVVRMVAMLRGYRVARASAGDPRGRTDILVLVRRQLEYFGELVVRTQDPMPKVGPAAHTRYVVAQLFKHPDTGKTALVGWHPTPGPVALRSDAQHPITMSYQRALDDLGGIVEALRLLGYAVIVCSDTQVPVDSTQPWAPIPDLAACELKPAVARGIDIIVGDRDLRLADAGVLEPAGATTGADHPYLFAHYESRR